ncbi:hypothetical protein TURU_051355 [Turdus rufiventris]|nr:hypothetical protein TURU_051355 [Turdus rufiventris]
MAEGYSLSTAGAVMRCRMLNSRCLENTEQQQIHWEGKPALGIHLAGSQRKNCDTSNSTAAFKINNNKNIFNRLVESPFDAGITCKGPGVELSDPYGSLPIQNILRFKIHKQKMPCKAQVLPSPCPRQVRSYYVDWRMLRDVKRRKMAFEHADERLRINAIRKNSILPKELQEMADKEIAALPRDSCPVRIRNRCVLTSRPRGVKRRWRLSRIVFRHFADHAQMSGVQRAMW